MKFLEKFFNAIKGPSQPLRDPAISHWFGGATSHTGINVTPETAMQVVAVFACVRVISETLASLPWILYKQDGRNRVPDIENPLYNVLHRSPNRWQTSFEFREMMQGHLLLRGNAYARKVSNNMGVTELIPLHPDRVKPFFGEDGRRWFAYRPPQGEAQIIPPWGMFHVPGFSSDGLSGQSMITLHREAIGLAKATEEHGARVFANGTNLGGLLTHPGHLKEETRKHLAESWSKQYEGIKKAGKTALLEEGLKFEKLGMSNEDAQYLETRKFQITEIARMFRVPPHKIADLDKATFSNIEQQSLEFFQDTMMPWLVRWEQAAERDLIVRPGNFVKFKEQAILRGDLKSRYESYAIARNWGWMSANDIRELEDMDPIKGGDVYLSPLNMTPADEGQEE